MTPFIVAIVGAESTGKTCLARDLAGRLGACWVPEVLREWCDREGRTPRIDEQAGIAAEQARRIEQQAAHRSLVIADTTPLMTAVYSEIVFGDRSLYPSALAWQQQHVGLTLLTGLDLPWQADGLQRDGPQVRGPVDALLRRAFGSAQLPFSVVYGKGEDRVQAALRALASTGRRDATQDQPAVEDEESTEAPWRPRCLECLRADCERAARKR